MEHIIEYPHLSAREFALDLCGRLRTELGVDIVPILSSPVLSDRARVRAASTALMEAILDRAHRQGFSDFFEDGVHAPPAEDMTLAYYLGTDRTDTAVETEPNMALKEGDAEFLVNLRGDAIKNYIFNLTKRFENMANATSIGQLVAEMAAGGVISVGVPAAIGTVKALRAKETLLVAMRSGIKSIGLKTAIVAVVVIMAALLFYLLYENPKKILGMVLNNTEENFVVTGWDTGTADLHMEHGQMVNFMQDNEDGLQSPMLQLKQKLNFGPNDKDNVVFAGFYFADRNIGFRGAEGVAVFSSKTSSLAFAHMFAVPYINDNGTNMRLVTGGPGDLSKLYREMYDTRQVRVDVTANSYRLTSTVNDPKGGVVGCIASIQGPV